MANQINDTKHLESESADDFHAFMKRHEEWLLCLARTNNRTYAPLILGSNDDTEAIDG